MSKRRGKPYHLRFHGDALGGYELLTLEERGAYTTLLDQMYDHGGPLRDDVRNACAWLNCDVRVWKRIRAALVDDHAKLKAFTDAEGRSWLVNDRVQTELKLQTYRELTANLGDKLAIAKPELSAKSSELPKENNVGMKTKTPENAPLIPSPIPITPISPKGKWALFKLEPEEPKAPADEVRQAFDLWNLTAEACGLPKARTLDEGRRKAIRKRLDTGGLDLWRDALKAVEVSAFLRGLQAGSDGRLFKADLTFVCQAKSFRRLLDGFYGADAPTPRPAGEPPITVDPWRQRLGEFVANGHWNRLDWGAAPGKPDCTVAPEILAEFGFGEKTAA